MTALFTPRVRAWVYGVSLAVLPLLIAYGVLSRETAPLWAALAGAILVPATALAHVGERGIPREPGEHAD